MKAIYEKGLLVAKGFCMGAADVVPGVSGGTMALITGIYQQLLNAIRSFDTVWVRHILKFEVNDALRRPHFGFIIPLAIGILAAIIFFTRVVPIPELLHTHPEPIYGLFFGLIIGSVVSLIRETGNFNLAAAGLLIVGVIVGWTVVNLVPFETPDASWFIFLCGFIAISAMLLPGISGSFLLLIMRKYDVIFSGIGRLDFGIIIPFALGALGGIIVFSRALGWLLDRFYRETLLVIVGVLIGALWIIWPFQEREYIVVREKQRLIHSTPTLPEALTTDVMFAIGMMVIGLVLVLWLNYLASGKQDNVPAHDAE